jgi:NhaP-type Na+/H+ or K+/H+ antiporter
LAQKRSFPYVIFILIGLILLGNLGFNYIVNLLMGFAEFQPMYVAGAFLLFGSALVLSLRVIYQIDRQGGRLKRKLRLFEPVEEN